MPFNRLNHSILGEIRPRFALKIAADPEKAMACLEDGFKKDSTVGGVFAKNHLFLKVPERRVICEIRDGEEFAFGGEGSRGCG